MPFERPHIAEPLPNQPHLSAQASRAAASSGGFLSCFLGLAATRVWLQANMFGSYTQSDDGLFSIVSNFAYGLVMLVAALIAWRRSFSNRGQQAVAWVSVVLMTASTVVILAGKESGSPAVLLIACVMAGAGGAFGGGMWTIAYVRLGMRQAVLYGFLSLALGSFGGLILGFLPEMTSYTASIFMPAIALLCYQRALHVDVGAQQAPIPVYDEEPRSTMLFVFGGIAVFGLALGISRGFPAGEPVPLDPAWRIVHQVGVIALSLFVIWWVVLRGKRLSFSFLWRIEIIVAATGMLILSALPGHLTGLAIATVNIADTFMLGVLWVTMQDVSRHTTVHPYAVYGFAWAARIFSRNAGRILIIAIGATSYTATVIIGIVVFALAVSMAVLLSDGIPRTRKLFADEEPSAMRRTGPSERRPKPPAADEAGFISPSAPETVSKSVAARPETADDGARVENDELFAAPLQEECGLSDREMQVALLIAQGRSKVYIAEQLFITENTVRTHAKNAYAKLGVHSKQELMDLFERQRNA